MAPYILRLLLKENFPGVFANPSIGSVSYQVALIPNLPLGSLDSHCCI